MNHEKTCRGVALAMCIGLSSATAPCGAAPAAPPQADILAGQALAAYVKMPDQAYEWQLQDTGQMDGLTLATLKLASQNWRGGVWRHTLYLARPQVLRCPDTAYLEVTHSVGKGILPAVKQLAEASGAWVAVLTDVPNQPLYGGRYEDALIAYTFDQYLRSGDTTWPLLLPMVKSAVRAMDAIQACALEKQQVKIERFVISGASKRGWTSWLSAAVDPRICAMVPAVIDMLNLGVQTKWSQRVYGRQSEKIHDYTDIGLIERMDLPETQRLMRIVDPYSYRNAYTMPKLLLLGTNDPYWTVDALRHYWDGLPEPKCVYQAPNAGHGAGGTHGAMRTRTAFLKAIAEKRDFPQMTWQLREEQEPRLQAAANQRATEARLWRAHSASRDFRKAVWRSSPAALDATGKNCSATLRQPAEGYEAFMLEFSFGKDADGFALSTQVFVLPDISKEGSQ